MGLGFPRHGDFLIGWVLELRLWQLSAPLVILGASQVMAQHVGPEAADARRPRLSSNS